jgi:ATP-dependent DNA helicase DinG
MHEQHADDIAYMPDVLEWIKTTETGDFSELARAITKSKGWKDPLAIGPLKSMLSCSADECLGQDCGYYDDECFPNKAKQKAGDVDLVVTNYHLLFAHLMVSAATGGKIGVLPQFDAVIWDEAHKAADIAREFFGDRLSYKAFERVASRLNIDRRTKLITAATRFFSQLVDFGQTSANKPRLRAPIPEKMWRGLADELTLAGQSYRAQADNYAHDQKRMRLLTGYAKRATRLLSRLVACCTIEGDPHSVYFVEVDLRKGKRPRATLNSKMVNVAPVLEALLWSCIKASVQTSATLAVNESFSYQLKETGVPELDSRTLVVDTPFNFAEQCVLVVPDSLPEAGGRTRGAWEDAVPDMIESIVQTMGGRTLCLFTTYKMLRRVAEQLQSRLNDIDVLVQGDASMRTQLVERFRADETSVLLGTESFWAGVDCPGPACSCVIMDKFPFPPPDDPIMDAFQEREGKACFMKHSVPRAVIQFRQGFGRLIRRTTDKGIVVFLDKRIKTKGYGKTFIRSLPDMPHEREVTLELVCERVEDFSIPF